MRRLVCVAALLAVGCAHRAVRAPKKRTAPPPSIPPQVVNMAPGNSTEYSAGPKREPLWYVEWHKSATVDVSGKGDVSHGMMEGVSGFVYEQMKPTIPSGEVVSVKGSTFESKKGQGDQTRKILSLIGDVHVHSITRSADLFCDRLVYDAKAKQIRAGGHVRVVSHVGTIGPVPQLWATPDLKVVATPRMFSSP